MDYETLKEQWSDVEDRDGVRLSWNVFPSSRMVSPEVICKLYSAPLTRKLGGIATRCPHRCPLHPAEGEARHSSAPIRACHLQTALPLGSQPILVSIWCLDMDSGPFYPLRGVKLILTCAVAKSMSAQEFGSAPSACQGTSFHHTIRILPQMLSHPNCTLATRPSNIAYHVRPLHRPFSSTLSICARRRTAFLRSRTPWL
jgi:hypothetical protein